MGANTISLVHALKEAIPLAQQGRITMAVGLVKDANGARSVLIGTSEANGYLRQEVALGVDEILAAGRGHAEVDIVNYASRNGWKLLEVGATRPICPACASRLDVAGVIMVTPLK